MCENHGVLILEKVAWSAECESCGGSHDSHVTLGSHVTSQRLPERRSHSRPMIQHELHSSHSCNGNHIWNNAHEVKERKRSIFDIFWEKINTPLKNYHEPLTVHEYAGVRSQLVTQRGACENHASRCMVAKQHAVREQLGIPIGCYNVYM